MERVPAPKAWVRGLHAFRSLPAHLLGAHLLAPARKHGLVLPRPLAAGVAKHVLLICRTAPVGDGTWVPPRESAGGGRRLRFSQGGRANLRSERAVPSEGILRAELELFGKTRYRLVPFVEARRNLDESVWSRVELGMELGFRPAPRALAPLRWLYLGHGIHQAWLTPERDRPEWETRTLFDVPLSFLKMRSRPVSFYALNEYTYDLASGKGVRNEIGVGLKLPLPIPRWQTLLGWRHVDLIHAADIDQFEGSLAAEF